MQNNSTRNLINEYFKFNQRQLPGQDRRGRGAGWVPGDRVPRDSAEQINEDLMEITAMTWARSDGRRAGRDNINFN